MTSVNLLGYQVSAGGERADVANGIELMASGSLGNYMACLNPHSLVSARTNVEFETALKNADILLPDGIGIIIAAKLLQLDICERVAGFEFFHGFSQQSNKLETVRYFFLGATEEVLDLIEQRLSKEFPNIDVVGTYSPPFKAKYTERENEEMIRHINDAKPDALWVGLTAPKQELWISRNRIRLEVPFIGAIGAVFDFYAGTKKRAPRWVQALGLEWLPRFLREPVRLFERNLISNPIFLTLVIREYFRRRARN